MEKLKQGDYVTNLTEEQFDELIEIEGFSYVNLDKSLTKTLGFDGRALFRTSFDRVTKLPFDVFKQRAINTFKG